MAQFTHIARPGVFLEQRECVRRYFAPGYIVFARVNRQEVLQQRGYILSPASQRRQRDLHGPDAKQQVLPQYSFILQLAGGAVGCGDEPDIDRGWIDGAHRDHFPSLQNGQQLALQVQRQIANLIEEQRTAVGRHDPARAIGVGAGECAALVSEQLTFKQRIRQCAEVNTDKRFPGAPRQAMNFASRQFFAGAALAEYEYVRVRGSRAIDDVENLPQCDGTADQLSFGRRGFRNENVVCECLLRACDSATAADRVATSLSFCQGFNTKSTAPFLSASTASDTPPKAVMSTTDAVGTATRRRPSQSKPSRPVRSPGAKFMSSRMASGTKRVERADQVIGILEGHDFLEVRR